ncbi:MAG: YlxM family DNA-binding protein [Lachnospiraceae bacterium]|nr:YlxM family DNA-binding protein [Lachnospiraceae bacterium]
MEKIVEQGLLYDFYGPLLTEHQQEIYEACIYEDLSLAEAAERFEISRQGVHDLVKRCDKILKGYEEKLGLINRFNETNTGLEEIKCLIEKNKAADGSTRLTEKESNRVLEILNKIGE